METINYCQSELNYTSIPLKLYNNLNKLGLIPNNVRESNVGKSNYSKHIIQPWSIWIDYDLNAWDADIVKRVLRTKDEPNMTKTDARIMDYKKIIHICQERIRQLQFERDKVFSFISKEKITTTSNSEDPILWVPDTAISTLEVESNNVSDLNNII